MNKNLFDMVRNRDVSGLKKSIDNGLNVNEPRTGLFKDTLLHYAAGYEDGAEVVKLLLSAGANPNEENTLGNTTPLHIAADHKCVENVNLLLEAGANPNAKGSNDDTPLIEAIVCQSHDGTMIKKQLQIVTSLLKYGAYVDQKNRNGNTALHIAAKYDYSAASMILLHAGAKVNEQNDAGQTPMDRAIERRASGELKDYIAVNGGRKAKDLLQKTKTLRIKPNFVRNALQ